MNYIRPVLLLSLLCSSLILHAEESHFESGPRQTVMIELYTSEGCSSCPPADHYLNQFVDNPQLWQRFIPMAFHVDYWDYLGWRDRFASAANSQRQRHYAQVLKASTVYTPEFFVNGKEWRRGIFSSSPDTQTEETGVLQVHLKDDVLRAEFQPRQAYPQGLVLNAAILGMQLRSQVRAGENSGRQLTHQFVVLSHTQMQSNDRHWRLPMPTSKLTGEARRALVVWVSRASDPRPLQATGGYLPK